MFLLALVISRLVKFHFFMNFFLNLEHRKGEGTAYFKRNIFQKSYDHVFMVYLKYFIKFL